MPCMCMCRVPSGVLCMCRVPSCVSCMCRVQSAQLCVMYVQSAECPVVSCPDCGNSPQPTATGPVIAISQIVNSRSCTGPYRLLPAGVVQGHTGYCLQELYRALLATAYRSCTGPYRLLPAGVVQSTTWLCRILHGFTD